MAPSKHAKLSPSSSATWLNCTAAVDFVKSLRLREKQSKFADAGSMAHHFGEKKLRGTTIVCDDKEMEKHTNDYVDYCKALWGNPVHIEAELPLFYSKIGEICTSDFISVVGNTLHVVDFKYGIRTWVDVEITISLSFTPYAL